MTVEDRMVNGVPTCRVCGQFSSAQVHAACVTVGLLQERIAELERERDRQAELRDEWQALAQEFRGIAQRRSAERDVARQVLQEWQDHLSWVHHVACDYPFRTDLPEDYTEAADGT